MITEIITFKQGIENLKNNESLIKLEVDKSFLCKLLVMANIAEMCIYSNTKIPENERVYFEGQAVVGRYFDDWGLPWITDSYYKICQFVKSNYW